MADLNAQVQELYVAYLGRPADVPGLSYWTKLSATPDGWADTVKAFATSAEYTGMVAGQDNRALVDTVYEHLFGRHAEQAGVDYWAGLLDSKVITISDVVTAVADGAQGRDDYVFEARMQMAEIFTAHLDTPVEMLSYSGDYANKAAHNYLAEIRDEATALKSLYPPQHRFPDLSDL